MTSRTGRSVNKLSVLITRGTECSFAKVAKAVSISPSFDNMAVCSGSGVRSPHCAANRTALVGGQDCTWCFCQRAKHAGRFSERLLVRQVLLVQRAIAVADDEQTALGSVSNCDRVPNRKPAQEDLKRERVSDRGHLRLHSASSVTPLPHRTIPRQGISIARQGVGRQAFRLVGPFCRQL